MLKDTLNKFKTLSQMFLSCTQSSFTYWKMLCLLEYFAVYVNELEQLPSGCNSKQSKDAKSILLNLNKAMKCIMQGSPSSALKYMKAAHRSLVTAETTGIQSDFFEFDRFDD